MSMIIKTDVVEEMKSSYLDYSMSVIVSRALPDVKDGLKPVHRRILYAAQQLGLYSNSAYKKSARLVGEVLGKYHPHGDISIYDAVVRMAQDFSMRYPLIDGQGNFGSIDGDSAAAMRYTELRLSKIAEETLEDIDKDTVDWLPNFDETLKEPVVLPSKVPNLIINGASGIAVGMTTNIPPHNLKEVADALIYYIHNPDATVSDLMKFIPGPDFPTGGIIEGNSELSKMYKTGKGKIILTSKYHFEDIKSKRAIVVTEIPYQVNKSVLITQIADLVKNGSVELSDIRDESDRHGIRIVLELKRNADENVVVNRLLAHTNLRISFNAIFLALVDGQPKILNLQQVLFYFLKHREEVIRRRTTYLLRKANERLHIVLGLLKAIDKIDATVDILKHSRDVDDAITKLKELLEIDDIQAKAILDMKLQRIIGLERNKLMAEKESLESQILEYQEILNNRDKLLQIIVDDLEYLKNKYKSDRRTEISEQSFDFEDEDLIKDDEVILLYDEKGYAKTANLDTFKVYSLRKAMKGLKEETPHLINGLFTTQKQIVFYISDKGRIFSSKTYRVPFVSKKSKGKHFSNIIGIRDEKITSCVSIGYDYSPNKFLFMVTNKGVVKKSKLSYFTGIRKTGIIAIGLEPDEYVVSSFITSGNDDIVLYTRLGNAIRFSEKDVRDMGRTARGVRGINLSMTDFVKGGFAVSPEMQNSNGYLITITEKGYGKKTLLSEYSRIGRGGKGVKNIRIDQKNGFVASCFFVTDEDEFLFFTDLGYVRRLLVREIPTYSRISKGVKVTNIGDDRINFCVLVPRH